MLGNRETEMAVRAVEHHKVPVAEEAKRLALSVVCIVLVRCGPLAGTFFVGSLGGNSNVLLSRCY